MPNTALGVAMTHITLHPEQHDQRVWFCRTTACLAGRLALQAGAEECFLHTDTEPPCMITVDGRHLSVQEVAEESAGLTRAEGQHLFHASTTLEDMCHDTARLI